MKIKDDEMIIKRREYIDLLMENAQLREQASPFHKYSINEIRKILGFSKIELEEDKKIEKLNIDNFLDNETLEQVDADLEYIIEKINEIIDKLNKENK